LIAKAPTIESDLIQRFSDEGKLKSYQKKEVCVKIKEDIRGALKNSLESSLNRFTKIKNCTKVKIKSDFYGFRITINIQYLSRFSPKTVFAIISHFNVAPLGYCDDLEATMSVVRTKGSSLEVVFNDKLTQMPIFLLQEGKKACKQFSAGNIQE